MGRGNKQEAGGRRQEAAAGGRKRRQEAAAGGRKRRQEAAAGGSDQAAVKLFSSVASAWKTVGSRSIKCTF
jgi:hypothetical protein